MNAARNTGPKLVIDLRGTPVGNLDARADLTRRVAGRMWPQLVNALTLGLPVIATIALARTII